MKRRPMISHRVAAEALKELPGVWLCVGAYAASYTARTMATNVRTGHPAYQPTGAYDAYTQPVDDGTALYVRYTTPTEHAHA